MIDVVILISGRGSNMVAIAQAALAGQLPVRIAAVISNRADAAGLASAQAMGIPTVVVPHDKHTDREAYDETLAAAIDVYRPDLVVLAGFMRILSAGFVRRFAGRMFNIHPSLLPAYRGLHTHQRVLEAREPFHGCSVHFVTEELDGGPVVVQARVATRPDDTVDALSARIHVQEHKIYSQAIGWFASGRLTWAGGEVLLDGKPLTHPVVLEEKT